MPPPGHLRKGIGLATTTRRTPARITASVQGGVLPWWQHGSSVTYSVAPAACSPAARRASISACGPPNRACHPSPTTCAPAGDHAADHRVRFDTTRTAARQLQRPLHVPPIEIWRTVITSPESTVWACRLRVRASGLPGVQSFPARPPPRWPAACSAAGRRRRAALDRLAVGRDGADANQHRIQRPIHPRLADVPRLDLRSARGRTPAASPRTARRYSS